MYLLSKQSSDKSSIYGYGFGRRKKDIKQNFPAVRHQFSVFYNKLMNRDGAVVRAIDSVHVISGLSLLLVLVPALLIFLRLLRFSSLHQNEHSQIPIQPGNSGWKSHSVEPTEIPF